jgi:hypothetical protein
LSRGISRTAAGARSLIHNTNETETRSKDNGIRNEIQSETIMSDEHAAPGFRCFAANTDAFMCTHG